MYFPSYRKVDNLRSTGSKQKPAKVGLSSSVTWASSTKCLRITPRALNCCFKIRRRATGNLFMCSFMPWFDAVAHFCAKYLRLTTIFSADQCGADASFCANNAYLCRNFCYTSMLRTPMHFSYKCCTQGAHHVCTTCNSSVLLHTSFVRAMSNA